MTEYTIAEFRANTREILNAVDQGAEVMIKRYDNKYRLVPFLVYSSKASEKTVEVQLKPGIKKGPGQPVYAGEIAKYQKRIYKATTKIADQGLKPLKKIKAEIETVDACPHGFAKGFCKKEDCNRKYQQ